VARDPLSACSRPLGAIELYYPNFRHRYALFFLIPPPFLSLDGSDSYARGEECLIDHAWQLPVIRPPGQLKLISSGRYEGKFKVDLDGSKLPSSSAFKRGKVEYTLEARIIRKWSADIVQKQTIWFLSTTLPPIQTMPTITTSTGKWKEVLPYTIILPSDALFIGQRVPITFRFGPRASLLSDWKTTGNGGNALTILNNGGDTFQFVKPRIRLKQYYRLSTMSGNTVAEGYKYNVIDVELTHWPKSKVLDWEDTLLLQLPSIPELSPTTETKVYSVRHSLNLVTGIVGRKDVSGTMKIKGKFEGLPSFFFFFVQLVGNEL